MNILEILGSGLLVILLIPVLIVLAFVVMFIVIWLIMLPFNIKSSIDIKILERKIGKMQNLNK
jgi:uncharacterized membrane protein YciS (DUF1049 family)